MTIIRDLNHKKNSIKGMISDLSLILDSQMKEMFADSEYDAVRPADRRVFMMVSRKTVSLSEYARISGISRQAIHKSLSRLVDINLIELIPLAGSKRKKKPILTGQGREVQQQVIHSLSAIDQHLIDKVGQEKFDIFKEILLEMTIK